jgi:tetratricopeptide (TPR) repeat protein
MRPATVVELARRNGVALPTADPTLVYRYDSLDSFLAVFWLVQSTLATRDDWARLAYESVVDGAAHGVVHREAFFTPARHLAGGQDLAAIVGGLHDGIAAAEAETGVTCLLIADIDRAFGPSAGLELVKRLAELRRSGLDPLSTGVVYCELVCALQGLAQYDVAEEWTEAMERWCETNAIGSLHGRCRVHRAEILRLRGSCHEAESQALMACEELRPYLRRELGWPLNELGRIRLHRGDVAGAEEALLAAHRAGWDPQPGLALVRLAQGDVATAAASIRDALERPLRVPSKERPPNTDLQRAPLLEAQVEIEIAAGDIARARSGADELELIAARFPSKALAAGAARARGRVRLAEGDAAGAEQPLSEAVRLWNEVGAPYEAALARLDLAEAHATSGSEHRAVLERRAARTILDGIQTARSLGPSAVEHHDAVAEQPTGSANVLRREGDYCR